MWLRLNGVALQIAGYSKAVICIVEIWRDAGARRAARHFHMMPPRSSARSLALAARRAAWIALGRTRVVIRIVPVAAPLVEIVANVVKAKSVGGVACNPLRTRLPARRVVGKRLRRFVTPGKVFLFKAAARRTLPFGLGRQTVVAARLRAKPLAVAGRLKPGDTSDRLLSMAEI